MDRHNWTPKVFILKKDLPGIEAGARFQQTHQSDKVYFHGIPVKSGEPEEDQVGIIEFESKHVEDNEEWFEPFVETVDG